MDFANHRYANEQNCILFICKYDMKKNLRKFFLPPPPISKTFLRPWEISHFSPIFLYLLKSDIQMDETKSYWLLA